MVMYFAFIRSPRAARARPHNKIPAQSGDFFGYFKTLVLAKDKVTWRVMAASF